MSRRTKHQHIKGLPEGTAVEVEYDGGPLTGVITSQGVAVGRHLVQFVKADGTAITSSIEYKHIKVASDGQCVGAPETD